MQLKSRVKFYDKAINRCGFSLCVVHVGVAINAVVTQPRTCHTHVFRRPRQRLLRKYKRVMDINSVKFTTL